MGAWIVNIAWFLAHIANASLCEDTIFVPSAFDWVRAFCGGEESANIVRD